MSSSLRVGIIGANAKSGWAREGHVPAVRGLAGFELAAIATNSKETADAAAKAFGAPHAFASGLELARSADVDVVTVAVPVPGHHDVVLAALTAGKPVFCEWPLGRGIAESDELSAAAARAAGQHVAIGLPFRGSAVVRRTRAIIASGVIGRPLSMRVYSATAAFGPVIEAPYLYLEDPANFADLITIQGGHTVDLAIALGGELRDLNALATAQVPQIRTGPQRELRQRVTYDHLLVQGRFESGRTLSIEVAGGRHRRHRSRSILSGCWCAALRRRSSTEVSGGAPCALTQR